MSRKEVENEVDFVEAFVESLEGWGLSEKCGPYHESADYNSKIRVFVQERCGGEIRYTYHGIYGGVIDEKTTKYMIFEDVKNGKTLPMKAEISRFHKGSLELDVTMDYPSKLFDYRCIPGFFAMMVRQDPFHGSRYQVFTKTLTGKTITLSTTADGTLKELKRQITMKEGIPVPQIRLVSGGKLLEGEEVTMKELGINQDQTIHLVLRLRGVVGPPFDFSKTKAFQKSKNYNDVFFGEIGVGLNLIGVCRHSGCQYEGKKVVSHGQFHDLGIVIPLVIKDGTIFSNNRYRRDPLFSCQQCKTEYRVSDRTWALMGPVSYRFWGIRTSGKNVIHVKTKSWNHIKKKTFKIFEKKISSQVLGHIELRRGTVPLPSCGLCWQVIDGSARFICDDVVCHKACFKKYQEVYGCRCHLCGKVAKWKEDGDVQERVNWISKNGKHENWAKISLLKSGKIVAVPRWV